MIPCSRIHQKSIFSHPTHRRRKACVGCQQVKKYQNIHVPQTEEIGRKIITTAKISYKFSPKSPYKSHTFSRESPKFQTQFHMRKRSPRRSKDLSGKLIDLEIQIFEKSDLLRERIPCSRIHQTSMFSHPTHHRPKVCRVTASQKLIRILPCSRIHTLDFNSRTLHTIARKCVQGDRKSKLIRILPCSRIHTLDFNILAPYTPSSESVCRVSGSPNLLEHYHAAEYIRLQYSRTLHTIV